jgi:hypothetical protein
MIIPPQAPACPIAKLWNQTQPFQNHPLLSRIASQCIKRDNTPCFHPNEAHKKVDITQLATLPLGKKYFNLSGRFYNSSPKYFVNSPISQSINCYAHLLFNSVAGMLD